MTHPDHVVGPRCTCVDCTLARNEQWHDREQQRIVRIRSTRRLLGWPVASSSTVRVP